MIGIPQLADQRRMALPIGTTYARHHHLSHKRRSSLLFTVTLSGPSVAVYSSYCLRSIAHVDPFSLISVVAPEVNANIGSLYLSLGVIFGNFFSMWRSTRFLCVGTAQ
ncbi:hypothetical protein F4823DRAFT_8404 [Ustulina deusta]|nr:hypothetical protein F4823DRAFT_8404 [Ustulina deusta]